jgi:hypothetical protein
MTVERDSPGDVTGELPVFPLVDERSRLLAGPRCRDVTHPVLVHLDLFGNVTMQQDGLSLETLLPAQGSVISCKDSIDTQNFHERLHDLRPRRFQSRTHELDYGPTVVPVYNERRQGVSFTVNHAICIRNGFESNAATHRILDALAPPRCVDFPVGVGLQESQRDL